MGPLKLGILALGALALAACQEEAGFTSQFPPVGGPAPLPAAGAPTDITPEAMTTDEMTAAQASESTEALNAAVNEALAASENPQVTNIAPAAIDPTTGDAIASDSGVLNLALQSQEEQKRLREADAAALATAAAQRVVIQPGQMPEVIAGVNIITYARETTNTVGQRQYRRPIIRRLATASQCSKFASADDAQRNFLANGGPQDDPLNLDPDGDGFACRWNPEAYRALVLN